MKTVGLHHGAYEFTALYSRTPAVPSFRFHHHDMYEFYILLDGNVSLWIENTLFAMKPYTLIIYPPNSLHGLLTPDDHMVYERMYFHIPVEFMEHASMGGYSIVETLRQLESEMRLVYQIDEERVKTLYRLIEKLSSLDHTNVANDAFASYSRYALLSTVMLLLMDTVERQRHSDLVVVYQRHSFLSQVLQYINLHFREKITLEMIAKHANVSKYHLSHEFTRLTNRTLTSYISSQRLHYALKLLQNGRTPTDACFESGFSGYSSFQKAFHAYFGVSPKNHKLLDNSSREQSEK